MSHVIPHSSLGSMRKARSAAPQSTRRKRAYIDTSRSSDASAYVEPCCIFMIQTETRLQTKAKSATGESAVRMSWKIQVFGSATQPNVPERGAKSTRRYFHAH